MTTFVREKLGKWILQSGILVSAIAGFTLRTQIGLASEKPASGLYLSADASANFMEDLTENAGVASAGSRFEMDTGYRIGLVGGYNFTRYVGAEVETGFLQNRFTGGNPQDWYAQVPILANVVFRWENSSRLVPFLGAGAGGAYSIMQFGDSSATVSDGDMAFAWQGMAGLRYEITDRASIGLIFKYLAVAGSEFNLLSWQHYEFTTTRNYSLGAVFNLTF